MSARYSGTTDNHSAHKKCAEQWIMSAFGPKRTYQVAPHMSAFGGKADMAPVGQNVRRNSDLRIAFMFAETIKLIVEFTLIISVFQTRNAILIICGALLASAELIDTPANAQKRLRLNIELR